MSSSFHRLLKKLGWTDKVFLVLLTAAFLGNFLFSVSGWELLLTMAAFVFGIIVATKWLIYGLKKAIWRLRYRLLVTYLFIGFVPIVLLSLLVWLGSWIVSGQVASFLITSELERSSLEMLMPARGLAWTEPAQRNEYARWIAPAFWDRFPGFQIVVRDKDIWRFPDNADIAPPPAGWGDATGLTRRDGHLYLWAHAAHDTTDVTILVPVTHKTLASLISNLGEVGFRRLERRQWEMIPDGGGTPARVPPAQHFLDAEIPWASVVPIDLWDAPSKSERDLLFIRTRYSAVLRTIFEGKTEWRQGETAASTWVGAFFAIAAMLVIALLASILIGARLTRTITRAVHNLYQGTERVRVGDFSHRIEVTGNDQLANLGDSFNRMTEDLERLVEVAKEKERLQSEIEIAREVQNQLFPKNLPTSKTLELAAACLPARLVSGDYYDYMNLQDPSLALAIGDVAGKGISAALLMATVQSTMRTQLRAGREKAATAGEGAVALPSTAALVSRLNQQLYAFTPPEKFATFYFALYDDTTGIMTYTNAGHLPPILVRNGTAQRLDVTGTVVGAFSFAQYDEASVKLERGDLLVCFTDGVTEPENEFGEMYGEDRLADLVVKHAESDNGKIITAVMDSVRHWTGSPELQDDMTLLLARRI